MTRKWIRKIARLRSRLLTDEVFTLVLLATTIAVAIMALLSYLLFQESISAGIDVERLSNTGGNFASLELKLESFDPDSRTIKSNISLSVFDRDPAFGEPVDTLAVLGTLGLWFEFYELRTVRESQLYVEYGADDVEIHLDGDPTRFPFDNYEGTVNIWAVSSEDLFDDEDAPLGTAETVVVSTKFGGFSTQVSHAPHSDFAIRLERGHFDQVVFVLASALFLGVIVAGLAASFTDLGSHQPLAILLGIAGVAFALPAVRLLIVPSEVDTRTLFDAYVIIPFLVGSVVVGAVVAVRTLIRRQDYD